MAAVDDARRAAQHAAMKSRVERDVNAIVVYAMLHAGIKTLLRLIAHRRTEI